MAINDFGEKIGGAKKDLWKSRGMILSDLLEMNDAEKLKLIKKDNVWQKPDYAALVNDGLPIKVAYFIKTIRDSLGAKPVLTYFDKTPEAIQNKQEKYIEFVGAVRDAVMGCKTEADVLAVGNRKWLADNGFIEGGSSYYVKPTSAAGGVITNKFLRAFCVTAYDLSRYEREIERKQFLFNDEQKILSKYEFFKYANATWDKENVTYGRDATCREMIKLSVPGGHMFMYPKGEFAVESSWKIGTYFIIDKSHNVVARNFDTLEEAKKFVVDRDSAKEAEKPIEKKRKGKTRFVPAQLEHISRIGEDVRRGKSITGQDFLDVYDFKGGEFGNWMSEKDRQGSLDYGYEALYDLAKALKIDYKDISLGNSLSIAFGARGSGSALAHYETLREVINLTKMRGAGSLAHEWGHSFDDIIGKQLGLGGFMTAKVYDRRVPESFKNLVDKMKFKEVSDSAAKARRDKEVNTYKFNVRTYIDRMFPVNEMSEEQITHKNELIQVYFDKAPHIDSTYFTYVNTGEGNKEIDALSDFKKEITGRVIPKEERITLAHYQNSLRSKLQNVDKPQKVYTDFYNNSCRFDKLHSKTDHGYWKSNEEMFARAFACYVHDKVEGRSDYLCGHSEMAITWVMNESTKEDERISAVPQGEERKAINQCFDELFQELKDLGILHHKEDFTVENCHERREPNWEDLEAPVGETYQMSFEDLLENAYERAGNFGSSEQIEFDLDK